MLFLDDLNRIAQARHAELLQAGLMLPYPKECKRQLKTLYTFFESAGLNAYPTNPDSPGLIRISNKAPIPPSEWLPGIVKTAWELLHSYPSSHWTFTYRDVQQNKSVPFDHIKWVYAEAGHPLAFVVEKLTL